MKCRGKQAHTLVRDIHARGVVARKILMLGFPFGSVERPWSSRKKRDDIIRTIEHHDVTHCPEQTPTPLMILDGV